MDQEQMKLAEELLFSEEATANFAKKLFFGEFLNSAIFPYPQVSAEEKEKTAQFLQELKQTLDAYLDPDKIDRQAEIPKETIAKLGEIGLLGVSVSKEYGGLGRTQYCYCKAIEEVASRCSATAIFVNAHQSIGLKAILLFGTDAQKKKWLPDLSTGKKIAAFSLTEPNAGSDASGIETTAVYLPEKKAYRINGKKQWTSNGSIAGVLTLMAKTKDKDGKEKVTAFIITPDMPGFTITNPGLEKVGVRGTKTTNITLTNLEVPEENILGTLGGGLKVCLTALDYGRTTFGAMCLGAAKFCLQAAIQHAVTRIQFKKPLAAFPLVKKKIARMAALTYAMDATLYVTAGLIDRGVEDVMLESAILKVFASESLWEIIYETMQIYGGKSFFTDQPLERMMRDARLNMIGEGSNEVLRAFIGAVGLRDVGLHLKSIKDHPADHLKDIFSLGTTLAGLSRAPEIAVRHESLKEEANRLASAIKRFAAAVDRSLIQYKEEIIDKQFVLNRLASIAIAIYTSAAVLSKLDQEDLLKQRFAGHYYLTLANDQIEHNFNALTANHDELTEQVADAFTGL